LKIYISQGSVATQLRCDGIFSNNIIYKSSAEFAGKNILQSVNIWQRYGQKISAYFLADRTNGRAYATVLRLSVRPSVRRPSVTLCIVAKRCVLEQKLLLRAYRKSYMRNRLVPK